MTGLIDSSPSVPEWALSARGGGMRTTAVSTRELEVSTLSSQSTSRAARLRSDIRKCSVEAAVPRPMVVIYPSAFLPTLTALENREAAGKHSTTLRATPGSGYSIAGGGVQWLLRRGTSNQRGNMNDLILKSYLDDFARRFDYESEAEHLQFEYFVAHCLVAEDYQGHFNAEELSVGSANGIDSVAIFVNDVLVETRAEIDSLSKHNIDVRFLFIQTKTSPHYDQGDLLKFAQAVRYFFSKEKKSADYALASWHEIKDAIYRNAIKFADNPRLDLRYSTTSLGRPNQLLSDSAKRERQLLDDTRLFSVVSFEFVNAEDLKASYRQLSNKVTKQITFEKHTILPKIQGVKRAFIGILPCKDFVQLICDDQGKLLKNVFYDNVRDYQGENSVNREILSTITSDNASREAFVLLNNGVTVVCKSINPVGSEFTVRDFQVVNGCQTSHVLHRNVDLLSGNEFLTIKLIETEDLELANKITKATNRQTEVKLEAFAGLQPFHKELESFYASISPAERLFYERRPGQYDFDSTVNQSRVVSIPAQIKAFVSVFLEEPQKIHFYYGQLLQDYSEGNESALFSETHDPYPYYVASRLVLLIDKRLKRSLGNYLKWRYHLALMVRMLAAGPFNRSRLSDPAYCKRYCEAVLKALQDFGRLFEDAKRHLDKALLARRGKSSRDLPQDAELARALFETCRDQFLNGTATAAKQSEIDPGIFDGTFVGVVSQVVPEKKFGFIEYGQRRFFFRLESPSTATGSKVRFRVRKSGDTLEAYQLVQI